MVRKAGDAGGHRNRDALLLRFLLLSVTALLSFGHLQQFTISCRRAWLCALERLVLERLQFLLMSVSALCRASLSENVGLYRR